MIVNIVRAQACLLMHQFEKRVMLKTRPSRTIVSTPLIRFLDIEVIPKTVSGFNAFSFATFVFDSQRNHNVPIHLHHLRNASGIVYCRHKEFEFLQTTKINKTINKKSTKNNNFFLKKKLRVNIAPRNTFWCSCVCEVRDTANRAYAARCPDVATLNVSF